MGRSFGWEGNGRGVVGVDFDGVAKPTWPEPVQRARSIIYAGTQQRLHGACRHTAKWTSTNGDYLLKGSTLPLTRAQQFKCPWGHQSACHRHIILVNPEVVRTPGHQRPSLSVRTTSGLTSIYRSVVEAAVQRPNSGLLHCLFEAYREKSGFSSVYAGW